MSNTKGTSVISTPEGGGAMPVSCHFDRSGALAERSGEISSLINDEISPLHTSPTFLTVEMTNK